MHLYNLRCLTCLDSFFSYKKLSKKFATCAISYLSCQICYSKNCPKNTVHCAIVAMSTVQYTLRQPAKKCCPLCNSSHVHCAIYSQTTCQKMLSKPYPLQYTIRQTAKKCCPSYYKINISLKKCQQNQVTFWT